MHTTFSTAGGLHWGAIHAHSAISHCSGAKSDGGLGDMYIFCREAVGLDFCAITDHDLHVQQGDHWPLSKQTADLFNIPGSFATLRAYEWTSYNYGHMNVYYLDGDDPLFLCREGVNYHDPGGHRYTPDDLWDSLRRSGVEAITVPHHVAANQFRMHWDYFDPDFVPVVEMASGWGRFEYFGNQPAIFSSDTLPGYFVQDALERGYRLGFVCGSDDHCGRPGVPGIHWRSGPAGRELPPSLAELPGNPLGVQPASLIERWESGRFIRWRTLTAVYAPELTREAVFRAIQSRRCYGTTGARILLDFWLNDSCMGDLITLDDPHSSVNIRVHVRGTDVVDQVDIVKNGQLVHRHEEEESLVVEFSWTDPEATQPDNYYYVRVLQADGEMAWSSPIWVRWAHYGKIPGHQSEHTHWPLVLKEFHLQAPRPPEVEGNDPALVVWQAPLGHNAARLCLRWRGDEDQICSGSLRVSDGLGYRLRDRNLDTQQYGGDLYNDDHKGTVRWYAGCGPAWRGFDMAVVGGRGQEVLITPDRLPQGATLSVDRQVHPPEPVALRLRNCRERKKSTVLNGAANEWLA